MQASVCLRAMAIVAAALWTGTAAAAPCDSPAHRQFDFWVGEWLVHTPKGKLAGVNRIERKHGGCVLHERYETGGTYAGESLNIYDAPRSLWHQSWVDNTGQLLLLEGGLKEGSMVLEGQTRGDKGAVTRHRITWTPRPDGSVRQHWQSTDARGQWTTAFDGLYTRKKD